MKKRTHFLITGLIIWNLLLSYKVFIDKDVSYRIIDAERINIVEADGTKKMGIFSSGQYIQGKSQREGQFTISGMLFFNEEGYEAGGLVYDGKKISGGQKASMGLMFDGYRQDQAIAIQHNEYKDSLSSYYEDGIRITSRPDRSDVQTEYDFYKLKYPEKFGIKNTQSLDQSELDSIEYALSAQNKVAQQRIFLGSTRGLKDGEWFDESGIYIKNKYGKNAIKIFIDHTNVPRIAICDSLGGEVIYNLIPAFEKP
jgi:hypothetical protein